MENSTRSALVKSKVLCAGRRPHASPTDVLPLVVQEPQPALPARASTVSTMPGML
ncbi:hypothetical protein OG426_42865 [Streptomyces canus]|uniref:hypothetical protein n=1 Tax=Streptomyces canus TaxID=58343 RepID=UPI003866E2F8|nr:hypothetical protein OG426_42865 [Streptomyces canus]